MLMQCTLSPGREAVTSVGHGEGPVVFPGVCRGSMSHFSLSNATERRRFRNCDQDLIRIRACADDEEGCGNARVFVGATRLDKGRLDDDDDDND